MYIIFYRYQNAIYNLRNAPALGRARSFPHGESPRTQIARASRVDVRARAARPFFESR